MKPINIKCIISKSLNLCEFQILIFDKKNNCLLNKCCCGNIFFKPSSFGTYKIVIIPKKNVVPNIISSVFLYDESFRDIVYYFGLNKQKKLITIKLTDQIYNGLKLMKGEIKLWRNHM